MNLCKCVILFLCKIPHFLHHKAHFLFHRKCCEVLKCLLLWKFVSVTIRATGGEIPACTRDVALVITYILEETEREKACIFLVLGE
jgi:hypothetical protein